MPFKPIAIVESEKTAVIASVYMPEFIWLAAGSVNNLKPEKLYHINERDLIAFPDLGCFAKWLEITKESFKSTGIKLIVSDFLELNATRTEIEAGFDLADFLVKRDNLNPTWALTDEGYPLFWDLGK
jgi:hypothetical protein